MADDQDDTDEAPVKENEAYGVLIKEIDDVKGKSLFASKSFSKGDVIFQEKPLVCVQFLWNAEYKYLACDHCLKSLETSQDMARRLTGDQSLELPNKEQCCDVLKCQAEIVTCPRCQVMYCCDDCRQAAFLQYHNTLCVGYPGENPDHPLIKIQETWKTMHYPPETANIMLIARIIVMILQSSGSQVTPQMLNNFCHSVSNTKEQIAHKLLGPKFQEQLDILRLMMAEVLYDERLEQWFTPEGFQSLFALIGRNGQGIGTSSLSVYVKNIDNLPGCSNDERQALDVFLDDLYDKIDKVSGQFLNCEGSGLYTLQSCCNHSCAPNAQVTFPFNNSTLVLEALEDIQEGEEIFISYLDECQRDRSRHSRQKYLKENYVFTCLCSKCELQSSQPDETSSEEEEEDDDEAHLDKM